jgi:hypothetical protein
MAANANGFEFIKAATPNDPWGCRKGARKVMINERRDGGLCQVWFTYPVSGGANCDYFGPRRRHKLRAVLRFLEGLDHLSV